MDNTPEEFKKLELIEITPPGKAEYCVIWLHGLGADGHDFESIVPELGLDDLNIHYIFPHAPIRPVTINAGTHMRAWYDIDPASPLSGTSDIAQSTAQIYAVIEQLLEQGMDGENIVLAGFSQGGVVALELGLTSQTRFAGLLALSTYIHDLENLGSRVALANIDTPIFMAHGRQDPMIPITRAMSAKTELEKLNYALNWHEYDMGHQLCLAQIRDIAAWLRQTLLASST